MNRGPIDPAFADSPVSRSQEGATTVGATRGRERGAAAASSGRAGSTDGEDTPAPAGQKGLDRGASELLVDNAKAAAVSLVRSEGDTPDQE